MSVVAVVTGSTPADVARAVTSLADHVCVVGSTDPHRATLSLATPIERATVAVAACGTPEEARAVVAALRERGHSAPAAVVAVDAPAPDAPSAAAHLDEVVEALGTDGPVAVVVDHQAVVRVGATRALVADTTTAVERVVVG